MIFNPNKDLWLEPFLESLGEPIVTNPILELGCGFGQDTKYLIDKGFNITATDISKVRLAASALNVPKAKHLLLDLKEPFSFENQSFSVILASLCLHYFEWQKTIEITYEIWRCLKVNGLLLARFNSVNDKHYGSVGHKEISPNFYQVKDMSKRFFDEASIRRLFDNGWEIKELEEMTIHRYSKPKVVWQLVAVRID